MKQAPIAHLTAQGQAIAAYEAEIDDLLPVSTASAMPN